MKNELLNKIKEFNSIKEGLTKLVKCYVQDTNYPLEERWSVFINSELGNELTSIYYLKSYDISKIFDGDYRHETIFANALLGAIDDCMCDENFSDKEIGQKLLEVKEELLSQFVKSFKYDW